MNAFNALSQFATFSIKIPASTAKEFHKSAFKNAALAAIKALETNTAHQWVSLKNDGTVGVTLKRGVKALIINGNNIALCPNVKTAIKFLNLAIELCNSGGLNAELDAAKKIVKTKV